jgi:hypothetical protein
VSLVFNHEGMHIFSSKKEPLNSYAYADIFRWGGSSGLFSVIIGDEETGEQFDLSVTTSQSPDMAAIILDHIRAIMAMQSGGRKR